MPTPVLLSVLERIARASGGSSPPPATADDLHAEVVRHLEWIFNTRRGGKPLPPPLDRSILAYGLPDFKFGGLDEQGVRDRIGDALTEAVRNFEPRLSDTVVTIDPGVDKDLRMRIRVKAMLHVEPEPQPFLVETRLDLATREFVVGRDGDVSPNE